MLIGYAWPGNVRELGAVIERAAILGGGRRLEIAAALGVGQAEGAPAAAPPAAAAPPRIVTLDEATARHIEQALAATRGRIEGPTGAAALLGINPHTLRARMRKLGVQWSAYRIPGAAAR
jgi:DNA-binding NtrC family response regulator